MQVEYCSLIWENDSYCISKFSRGKPTSTIVVTFTERGNRHLDGVGFAGKFVLDNDFVLIAVKSKSDNWYQDLPDEAIHLLQSALEQCGAGVRRAAYGSSMGAYAAIKLSNKLGLDAVVAISPLTDISSKWDMRWYDDATKLPNFDPISEKDIAKGCHYIIIYDPYDKDRMHFHKISMLIKPEKLSALHTRFSGHPAGHFLNEIGLLKMIAFDGIVGNPIGKYADKLSRLVRSNKEFMFNLCGHLMETNKFNWALNLAEKTLLVDPLNAEYNMRTSSIEERLGRISEAIAHAAIAVALRPDHPHMAAHLARLLNRLGLHSAALAHIEKAVRIHPESETFQTIRHEALQNISMR